MNCNPYLRLTEEERANMLGKVILAIQYLESGFYLGEEIVKIYDSTDLPHKPIVGTDFTHDVAEDLKDLEKPIENGATTPY